MPLNLDLTEQSFILPLPARVERRTRARGRATAGDAADREWRRFARRRLTIPLFLRLLSRAGSELRRLRWIRFLKPGLELGSRIRYRRNSWYGSSY